ncbi:MAG TPA: polyprenyl synthetase family protein [Kiritimatiellia bacterium]|nr:polyprenyl synthetase family protein [Kiritimatiellia bacterium]HNS81651.1 polyprenyl synthetase family protein [Kiritimatiellia bacterium]HPA78433.1 polyprenyl synthetase family protein [Kiritimatiellia bacterium]HQQ04620.1 polyprenyl synthetase family protein [Kiritimatiellia bacterium]
MMKGKQHAGIEGEEAFINGVRARINELLAAELPDFSRIPEGGKMLRARLVYAVGGRNPDAAAAVELMHGGSLLHDDIIDNGILRRGRPAFWKTHGAKGAILLGDMHFFLALKLLNGRPQMQQDLIEMAGMVCKAAAEEELCGASARYLELARQKTGPLFAFAASAGAPDTQSRAALREAGFLLGTAYQLADDIYDATGEVQRADKSLRRDRMKSPASVQTIAALCKESAMRLQDWPDLQRAWEEYLERQFEPAIKVFTSGASC